ncbi:MAG: hypothetical protein K2M39_05950 [Muribaculaceae bacterium]|nr:hypothetical protein [Muribaculaceae bacterium]
MPHIRNPFESLRIPGIVGKVASTYNPRTICQRGGDSVSVIEAEIAPGKYGFGYCVIFNGTKRQLIPGEGQGWFRSANDALLYALGYVRVRSENLPPDFIYSIDVAISKLRNIPLFDL